MHSAFLRANVIFFYAVSALFILACGCAAQYWATTPNVACSLAPPTITRFRQFTRPAQNWEHAMGSFEIDADLRPLWNWNTHQLFVYVSASWSSSLAPGRPLNQNVIWDRIVQSKEAAVIRQEIENEYTINDQWAKLKGANVTLSLHYDVMPLVGMLKLGNDVCSTSFLMPKHYV